VLYDPDNNPGFPPDDPRLTDFRWRRVPVSTARLSAAIQDIVPHGTVIGLALVCTGGTWELVVHSPDFPPAPNDGERLFTPMPIWEGV
jgi:hypothetical protein